MLPWTDRVNFSGLFMLRTPFQPPILVAGPLGHQCETYLCVSGSDWFGTLCHGPNLVSWVFGHFCLIRRSACHRNHFHRYTFLRAFLLVSEYIQGNVLSEIPVSFENFFGSLQFGLLKAFFHFGHDFDIPVCACLCVPKLTAYLHEDSIIQNLNQSCCLYQFLIMIRYCLLR